MDHGENFPQPAVEERARVKAVAQAAAINERAERKRNAFPVLGPADIVRGDVTGWSQTDAKVVRDDGPARDGARRITIEKISGTRAGERLSLRRDRVWPSPGR